MKETLVFDLLRQEIVNRTNRRKSYGLIAAVAGLLFLAICAALVWRQI